MNSGTELAFCAKCSIFYLAKPTKMTHKSYYFGLEYAPNPLSAEALPQTSLGELTALPQTH